MIEQNASINLMPAHPAEKGLPLRFVYGSPRPRLERVFARWQKVTRVGRCCVGLSLVDKRGVGQNRKVVADPP